LVLFLDSGSACHDKARHIPESFGRFAEWLERCNGPRGELFGPGACGVLAQNADQGRLAGRRVLADGLAHGFLVAFLIEQIIDDLEGKADIPPIGGDRFAFIWSGLAQNGAGFRREGDQGAGFQRLKPFDRGGVNRAVFDRKIDHLAGNHAMGAGCLGQATHQTYPDTGIVMGGPSALASLKPAPVASNAPVSLAPPVKTQTTPLIDQPINNAAQTAESPMPAGVLPTNWVNEALRDAATMNEAVQSGAAPAFGETKPWVGNAILDALSKYEALTKARSAQTGAGPS